MYCSRRLYKGNAYEICLPIADTGITVVRFYTRGDIIIEKEPETTGDSMCFSFTEEDLASLEDGVLRYGYDDFDTNSPYVVVTPGDYSGSTLDDLLEDAFDSGYTAGQEDCSGGTGEGVWASGYTSGFTDGVESVPAEPLTETITENGNYAYSPLEGYYQYVNLTVNVPQTGYTQEDLDNAYASGYSAGYDSGYTDGIEACSGSPEPVYSAMPLTFEIISGGTIGRTNYSGVTIEYSMDCGATWNMFSEDITVNDGDMVQFASTGKPVIVTFLSSGAVFNVCGNINSLLDKTNYDEIYDLTPYGTNVFAALFRGNTGVISAENLVLQATVTLEGAYQGMFQNCTNLAMAPSVLPSAEAHYSNMFRECINLETSPVICATTIGHNACIGMFSGCTNLNHITCLATDISTQTPTLGWVAGVASTGTFVKAAGATWSRGNSGIPTGWTVVDAT